jgi:phosphoribosyl-dephospho-CoA transferase
VGGDVTECVHTLLRIRQVHDLAGGALPDWAACALERAPWVVVRRERSGSARIPVGVRGSLRAQRWAAWLDPQAVCERVRPTELVRARAWVAHPRRFLPAFAVLDALTAILEQVAPGLPWGPSGSVGFELASGSPSAHAASDLDVILESDAALAPPTATRLAAALAELPVRVDVLLETPGGALALEEYVRGRAPYLLRTPDGARRVADPWTQPAAA